MTKERQPTTKTGISYNDNEQDGLTDLIVSIEDQAREQGRREVDSERKAMLDSINLVLLDFTLSDAVVIDRVNRILVEGAGYPNGAAEQRRLRLWEAAK